MNRLKNQRQRSQNSYRAALSPEADASVLTDKKVRAAQAEKEYEGALNVLYQKTRERGEIADKERPRNLGIVAGVGLPGLAGISYLNESIKNNE